MNPQDDERNQFDPDKLPVQTAQILCCALIGGVLIFVGIIVATGLAIVPPGDPFMAFLGAGFAAMSVVARILVPSLINRAPPSFDMNHTLKQGSSDADREALKLFGLYQTRMIVGLALLEGAAFFNIIAYMIAGHLWSLGVVGALVVVMLTSFPTRSRVAFWIENRLQM